MPCGPGAICLLPVDWKWETSWILEEWNRPIPPRAPITAPTQPIQLSLGFG